MYRRLIIHIHSLSTAVLWLFHLNIPSFREVLVLNERAIWLYSSFEEMHLLRFEVWLLLCGSEYNQTSIIMNRQEFEELELQVQQSELPLKSYLQQIGVSYSTYHYWRRKCSVDRSSIKHELAPISFKQAFTESSQEEQLPHGVALLFPNGLRAHFGSGSEDLLKEIFTQSLRNGHV